VSFRDAPRDRSPARRRRKRVGWTVRMVSDVPSESQRPDDVLGAAATADRDALIELISVFTHDLNNPLQTVLVLSELALDETMPGTEGRTRAEQCLQAADRLRLLAQAMSGLFRGRPLRAEALWDRVRTLLGRRFERHCITAELTTGEPRDALLPALCERLVFTLALAAIGAAATSGRRNHVLELACNPASDGVALSAALFAVEPDGSHAPLEFSGPHLERLAALLRLDPRSEYREDGAALHIELALGE
jgi:signal transduction histidine kinase